MIKYVPLLLTLLRAVLAPIVVLLALFVPMPVAFAACLSLAVVLRECYIDVPTLVHALRLRRAAGA